MNFGSIDVLLYHYQAHVIKVYDGDTITVDIDLGLDVWLRGIKLRLSGINAPEMRGSEKIEGKESRDYLRELILDKPIIVKTVWDKKGKYGRYLAEIYVDRDGGYVCVNDLLVDSGHAEYKQY